MTKVYLKSKISRRIENGHPWIFQNEVETVSDTCTGGEIVEVFAAGKKFVGKGYINPKSQILVRLLTRNKGEEINEQFFYNKILQAWEYRKRLGYTENCRLVYGEADYLPALVVDKFNDYLVLQTMALGIEQWKDSIVQALTTIFKPKGIYERNDVPVRELEGMPQQKAFCLRLLIRRSLLQRMACAFMLTWRTGKRPAISLTSKITGGSCMLLQMA